MGTGTVSGCKAAWRWTRPVCEENPQAPRPVTGAGSSSAARRTDPGTRAQREGPVDAGWPSEAVSWSSRSPPPRSSSPRGPAAARGRRVVVDRPHIPQAQEHPQAGTVQPNDYAHITQVSVWFGNDGSRWLPVDAEVNTVANPNSQGDHPPLRHHATPRVWLEVRRPQRCLAYPS